MAISALDFYRQYSQFTYPGSYEETLRTALPDDVRQIGLLVRKSLIHRMTYKNGNTGSNIDLRYGDMSRVPWHRQAEDDNFPTAAAMIAELFHRDSRGFMLDRSAENKLILTCRFTSLLTASLLKVKRIPSRVRAGFASYFDAEGLLIGKSVDHWITEYWKDSVSKWVSIDVDGSLEEGIFDWYNVPEDKFDWPASSWLGIRRGTLKEEKFYNAGGYSGLVVVAWQLFYDFHSLMNNEIVYYHHPEMTMLPKFESLDEEQLSEIDNLAQLMLHPDEHFSELQSLWESKREFRLLSGGLL